MVYVRYIGALDFLSCRLQETRPLQKLFPKGVMREMEKQVY